MECRKFFVGVVLMASAAISSAQVTPPPPIDFSPVAGGAFTGSFGHTFGTGTQGQTFLDIYTFTLPGTSDFDAALTSIATVSRTRKLLDLDINTFDLYFGTTKIATGAVFSDGFLDVRTITSTSLPLGAYSLQVGGTVLGSSGGSYGGNVNVAPVPEPETWSMIFSGAAVVAYLSRRRRSGGRKPFGFPA